MSKSLEVGCYVLAGVLSIALYNNMNSTQDLTKHSNIVEVSKQVPKMVSVTVLPHKRVMTDEQKSNACFKQKQCSKLAEVIYFEDRGSLQGMKAVANVVLNRTKSDKFPSTVVGVVNQKTRTKRGWVCQFSYMCQLKKRHMADEDSKYMAGLVAWKAMKGDIKDNTNGADFYYNPSIVKRKPKFAKDFERVATISDHVFYRSVQ